MQTILAEMPTWAAVLLIPGIFLGFLFLQFIVALREKHMAEPYAFADEGEHSRLSSYVARNNQAIATSGFEYGGLVAHTKPAARILASLWMSPRRDILVITGGGTLSRIPIAQTWLYSPLRSGRILITSDKNDEGDPSGLGIMKHRLRDSFEKLLAYHEKRLVRAGDDVDCFQEETILESLHALHAQRTARLIETGRARWADDEQLAWRYTWRGAIRVSWGMVMQLLEALPQAWKFV
jgi:hypothetical protein